ncbi:hypothetical protein [Ureibacillus aquaedulcis]|uniref:Uncharacterized protein n=1 Tax=Ureibacillus aquaedulcis TaxID=3058421 RepID=A0ABT8GMC1_9BACL|nr:hypothetical protein [Ureibacillus sp. BA0131]MDN4492499.1 hypothetical protein [Ureibacillus sp. BA0131]
MKTIYHCLIMWTPFILLFGLAGFGLEFLEGNKIRTSEYMGLSDLGVGYLFLKGSLAFVLYPITFLPLTFIVSKFVKPLLLKMLTFSSFGGILGVFSFFIYDSSHIDEYNLSITNSITLFGVAGLLYALVENPIRRNIKFV